LDGGPVDLTAAALWPDHAYGEVSGIVLGVGSIYDDIYVQRYAIPVADFTGAPLSGAAPLTVTFDNRATPLYGTTGYTWTFGDGATSAITDPTHVYTTPGVYTVTLTVEVEDESDTLTRTHYVTVTAAGGVVTGTRVISYTYDPLGRLVEADYSTGESFEYRYDAASNRVAMTSTTPLSGTVVTAYTYDAANRLTDRAVSDGRAYTYTWSARGQLLAEYTQSYPVRTFAYDGAGQLVEATVFTLTTRFTYNGLGDRVAVEVVGQGVTTYTGTIQKIGKRETPVLQN
jgi:YD repeat-containing protein